LVSEFHLNENIHNKWDTEEYREPLVAYLAKTFKAVDLRQADSTGVVTLPGRLQVHWENFLETRLTSLLPLEQKASCLLRSDYVYDESSIYGCQMGGSEWILKLQKVDQRQMSYLFNMFSLSYAATLGRVEHFIKLTPSANGQETTITWTLSYSSDLAPKTVEAMERKRDEMLQ